MTRVSSLLSRAAAMIVVAAALLPGGAALATSAQSALPTTSAQAALPTTNAQDALSASDRACLACHGSEENAARHAKDGRKAQLVDVAAYARSVHGDVGCDGCHDAIALPGHPGQPRAADDAKSNAIDGTQVCRACHAKIVKAYKLSYHAELRQAGKKSSPDCTGCHAPHAVTAASVQDGPNNVCLSCHADATVSHQVWLPNAARHLQTVACAACHAPEAQPQVDLRLVNAAAPAGSDFAGHFEQWAQQADVQHDGLDAHEFRALLETIGRQGVKVAVHGRIELRSGIQAHWMPAKARALRDCFRCHDQDAPPYKRVTVSTLDASGGPVRHDAQREVLTSAITLEALKGFYALGGTRLTQLDWLLALALGAGISVPLLHFVARRILRRSAQHKE